MLSRPKTPNPLRGIETLLMFTTTISCPVRKPLIPSGGLKREAPPPLLAACYLVRKPLIPSGGLKHLRRHGNPVSRIGPKTPNPLRGIETPRKVQLLFFLLPSENP